MPHLPKAKYCEYNIVNVLNAVFFILSKTIDQANLALIGWLSVDSPQYDRRHDGGSEQILTLFLNGSSERSSMMLK